MRLELADFPVREVRLSRQTVYHRGVLEINKEELVALILEDKRVVTADLDVVFPNEPTRIVRVRDVVEPRIKVSGAGCVFPGIRGPVETVGEGRTNRLSGVTVMTSAQYRPTILSGVTKQDSGLVDMWGPGARLTPFASMINIVLTFKLVDGVTEDEAHTIIQSVEFRIAHQLAEVTKQETAENVEVFELSKVNTHLPKTVYIAACVASLGTAHPGVALYGLPITESLPTLVHPNEFLDGAVTKDTRRGRSMRPTTWEWLNQPTVLEMLREHGKRLNFLGVILLRTGFFDELGKQVAAARASQMAKLLGAEGVIITRITTSGESFVEVMLTVQYCERQGVKTVLLTPEWGGVEESQRPLVFYVPEATAMVSTGSHELMVTLPVPTKVIGAEQGELVELTHGEPPVSPWSELTPGEGVVSITGGVDWFGGMKLTQKER